jgi:hypothetical protein
MSLFERLEHACAAFIERAFARTFPSDVQPAQVARRLVAAMESAAHGDPDRPVAPSRYEVIVGSEDFARLAEDRDYLERQWSALLNAMARRVGIMFLGTGHAVVRLVERADLAPGSVEVHVIAADPTLPIKPPASKPAPTRYQLRMLKGVPQYGVYPIVGATTIGRNEESEVFLVDPSVSRSHARLEIEGTALVVRDLGSTNGTFVNGERVYEAVLEVGDVISVGSTSLVVEAMDA